MNTVGKKDIEVFNKYPGSCWGTVFEHDGLVLFRLLSNRELTIANIVKNAGSLAGYYRYMLDTCFFEISDLRTTRAGTLKTVCDIILYLSGDKWNMDDLNELLFKQSDATNTVRVFFEVLILRSFPYKLEELRKLDLQRITELVVMSCKVQGIDVPHLEPPEAHGKIDIEKDLKDLARAEGLPVDIVKDQARRKETMIPDIETIEY